MGRGFLLGKRQLRVRERAIPYVAFCCLERLSHQWNPHHIRRKVALLAHCNFDLAEGLKYCSIVLTAQEGGIDTTGDQGVKLCLR